MNKSTRKFWVMIEDMETCNELSREDWKNVVSGLTTIDELFES